VVEGVLRLYRERYFDFSGRHFHEKLRIQQTAGLVERRTKRGRHHRRRERRPCPA